MCLIGEVALVLALVRGFFFDAQHLLLADHAVELKGQVLGHGVPVDDTRGICWPAVLADGENHRRRGILGVVFGCLWDRLAPSCPQLVLETGDARHLPSDLGSNTAYFV